MEAFYPEGPPLAGFAFQGEDTRAWSRLLGPATAQGEATSVLHRSLRGSQVQPGCALKRHVHLQLSHGTGLSPVAPPFRFWRVFRGVTHVSWECRRVARARTRIK